MREMGPLHFLIRNSHSLNPDLSGHSSIIQEVTTSQLHDDSIQNRDQQEPFEEKWIGIKQSPMNFMEFK